MDDEAIWIVGVCPGDPELLTLKAKSIIQDANYVVGFEQSLSIVNSLIEGTKSLINFNNLKEVLEYIAQQTRSGKKCVICCYGDT